MHLHETIKLLNESMNEWMDAKTTLTNRTKHRRCNDAVTWSWKRDYKSINDYSLIMNAKEVHFPNFLIFNALLALLFLLEYCH